MIKGMGFKRNFFCPKCGRILRKKYENTYKCFVCGEWALSDVKNTANQKVCCEDLRKNEMP
jgi:hypothetical protein